MFSDKLLSLLQVFSKHELNRFRKFLCSPYFNEQEYLIRLFDCCDKALRDGPEALEALSKESAWKSLGTSKPLDEAQLRRIASELNQKALDFLALEYRDQHPENQWIDLQHVLDKPRLRKHLAGIERKLDRVFESEQLPASSQHLLQYQYAWNVYNRSAKTLSTAEFMGKLLPANSQLDSLYITQKLKLYLAWLSFRNFRATETELPFIEGYWDFLDRPEYAENTLLIVLRQLVRCLSKPDYEAYFDRLMVLLETKGHRLHAEDLRECYQMAQNYCALKINQGKTNYYRPVFELYKGMIEREVLLENEQLSEAVYKNIITISLQLGEYSWAEAFAQEYSEFLPATIRENARSYNLANLYFHQKKYGDVISLLNNVEYSDLSYSLGAKLILLRTYYESGEVLALDSLLESVRIYLRRNRHISKTMAKEFGNFIGFLKKLSTLDFSNSASVAAFEKKIAETPALISKKWLLEKIAELK